MEPCQEGETSDIPGGQSVLPCDLGLQPHVWEQGLHEAGVVGAGRAGLRGQGDAASPARRAQRRGAFSQRGSQPQPLAVWVVGVLGAGGRRRLLSSCGLGPPCADSAVMGPAVGVWLHLLWLGQVSGPQDHAAQVQS